MWIMSRMPNGRKVQQSTSDNSNPSPPLRNVSKESSNPRHPAPKIVRKRTSISDAQAERVSKKTVSTHAKNAHKQATLLYAREQKKEGGLSAKKVREIVLKDYEVAPSIHSIQRYVKEGLTGQSPMKKGPEKIVSAFVFTTMCDAFSSMININQLNGNEGKNKRTVLRSRIAAFFGDTDTCSVSMMRNLLKATAIDLLASKGKIAEHRRIQWTTYNNIKTWFDNWEVKLVELGFAEKIDGRTVIPECQLSNIINMDETCLSLDGSSGVRGGRPEAIFWNPNLP